MKAIYMIGIIALISAIMITPAAATTWYVHDGESIYDYTGNSGAYWGTVFPGDTIFVYNGSYGVFYIDKPNLKVIGEGADVVTVDCGGADICMPYSDYNATGSVLDGFKVVNSASGVKVGIWDGPAVNCIIRNCIFDGVTGDEGIRIRADNTTFENNVVSNATGAYCAVAILTDFCTIANNTIENNAPAGISLGSDTYGNNTVTRNNFISNDYAGIELYDAGEGNKIYLNNFVDNGVTATTSGTTPPTVTHWNSTEKIKYGYGGETHECYMGNYWKGHSDGESAECLGIWDTAYTVPDSLGVDHRPLMEPVENYSEVPAAADPDLTPTSIATDSLSVGMPAAITVDVSNIGSADAGSFNVTLKVEDTVIGSDTVASLGAGSSVPVVFTWTPDAAGSFNLTAIVDSDDAVAESDEANNERTREVTVEEQSTPTPPTSFLISGNITYDNGNPVMNPAVTVTNLATSEDFTVKTDAGSNYYLTLTDSTHITAGDTIRINASDGLASSETDHPVTASEITTGGFVQDMLLEANDRPDLTVTEKSEDWVSLKDRTYTVTYTVGNIGGDGAGVSTTSIKIDGVEETTDSVPALQVGENYTGTVGPFTLSGENDTIEVCTDSADIINELDDLNNCLENLLEAPGMPDLIVWVALKTPGYVNEDNILGVRVRNIGTEYAGSFNVSLAIDGTSVPEQTVPSLPAGETAEIEYTWMPAELGGHALSATVDTNNDVEESDETNNEFARTSVIIKRTDWAQFHYDVVHTGFSPSGTPNTNETLWISDEITAIGGTSTVVADGMVFAYGGPTGWSGEDGALYCLNEFTGAILWNISIPTPASSSWSSPAYHNGRVFTSTNTEAGCYNATTGEQIWVFENPTGEASCNGGPIVADGKVIVNDWQAGHFYCLDEETGELLWNFTETKTGNWGVGYAQGVPAYEDGKFYLTTWLYIGGNVYCVDADTGAEIWNQTTPLDTCGSPAVVDGTVYVTNYKFDGDGAIYAMDATDGSILWQQTIQRSDSTPAVAYGNVYVCGGCSGYSQMQTYCFNATTGNPIWSTDTGDEIGAWTCSVAVADDKVFVGHPGSLFGYAGTYALDAFTGDVIWSHPEGGSSPAVADDIVFTIGGGRVYAFYSEPQEPDLTVTAIKTPANLRNDVINPITATIENIGGSSAGNFDVLLTVDGMTIDTQPSPILAAGENTTIEFLWTPSSTGNQTLTVSADASDAVTESDESNNDLSQTVDVLDKLTVTANVRIEGMNETVWTGDVTFSSSVLTTTDGSIHYLNEPTALGALDEADKLGGFGYVLVNDPNWGPYVSEINSEPAIGWDGWMYRVNCVSPWVGAADYTLTGSDEVLWYFGAWTAPPLAIELSTTGVSPGEEFVATVTAYNGTSGLFESVDNATVYADGITFQTGIDGNATLSIDIAGDYMIYADKGTWADYTRSEKKVVTVLSVESYGESVYAKTNTRLAWRALGEPNDRGAVLSRNAMIAIELEETIPSCKDISVRVVRLGSRTVNFDVAVSSDGTNWDTIGSGTCGAWMTWVDCDFDGDFGDVRYIKITKPGTWWKPRLMGLDAVYAKN